MSLYVYVFLGCSESYSAYNSFQLSVMFANGTRVMRGADWNYTNQDGGWGYQGTVIRDPASYPRTGWLEVRWDNGGTNGYRVGYQGMFDLCRRVCKQ